MYIYIYIYTYIHTYIYIYIYIYIHINALVLVFNATCLTRPGLSTGEDRLEQLELLGLSSMRVCNRIVPPG